MCLKCENAKMHNYNGSITSVYYPEAALFKHVLDINDKEVTRISLQSDVQRRVLDAALFCSCCTDARSLCDSAI